LATAAGVVQLEVSGLFQKIMDVYGDEEKYPYGPPSHITRQIIDNPDRPAGGQILGATSGASSRSLKAILEARDFAAVEVEFQRAIETVASDPPAGVTAACSLIEALCKVYIEDEGLELPTKETIKDLWKIVSQHLGLNPGTIVGQDLIRILSSLTSVIDGIGALRTHAGSAHGHGRETDILESRHARLAIHAAHTLATFVIEAWESRKSNGNT